MSPNEVHIQFLPSGRGRRLYYFQGNFFHPMDLGGADHGVVKRGIRDFMRDHEELVRTDRADPAYQTLMQLADQGWQP